MEDDMQLYIHKIIEFSIFKEDRMAVDVLVYLGGAFNGPNNSEGIVRNIS